MLKKIFNSKTKNFTNAAIILAASTILSRFLGLYRDRLLAGAFGAGASLDIYFTAFRIPDLIHAVLVTGGLGATFLPIFSEEFEKSKKKAFLFVNNIMNLSLVFLGGLCFFVFLFLPIITSIIAPGFDAGQRVELIKLSRILLIGPIVFALSSIFSGMLQYFDRFVAYSMAPILYNLGIIFGIVVLAPRFGLQGLAIGVALGALTHLLAQVPGAIKEGFRYKTLLSLENYRLKKMLKLMPPSIIAGLFAQLTMLLVTALASTLSAGSISIFNLSKNLSQAPVAIIAAPLSVAVFPILAKKWAQGDKSNFWKKFESVLRQLLFLILPLSVLVFVLRAHIVRLVFGTGLWGWRATRLSAASLGIFCWCFTAWSLIVLFRRLFYSIQKTKPSAIGEGLDFLFTGIFSCLFLYLLAPGRGFRTLVAGFLKLGESHDIRVLAFPLALCLSAFIHLLFLFWILSREIGVSYSKGILTFFYKISAFSLLAGFTAWACLRPLSLTFSSFTFLGILFQAIFAFLGGGVAYCLSAFIAGLPEFRPLFSRLSRKT